MYSANQIFDFTGKHVVVTGGGDGFGRAIAMAFACNGAAVSIVTRSGADETLRLISEATNGRYRVMSLRGDVGNVDDVKRVVGEALSMNGPYIDVLINNAGIASFIDKPTDIGTDPIDKDLDLWDRILRINLLGKHLMTRECSPHMNRAGGNRSVIFVASLAGRFGGAVAHPSYTAAQAGIVGLMRQYAKGLAPKGIRSVAIAPGPGETQMTAGWTAEQRSRILGGTLTGKMTTPEHMAWWSMFLASDAASNTTNVVIDHNGGIFNP